MTPNGIAMMTDTHLPPQWHHIWQVFGYLILSPAYNFAKIDTNLPAKVLAGPVLDTTRRAQYLLGIYHRWDGDKISTLSKLHSQSS
jgi:hypothetical protein